MAALLDVFPLQDGEKSKKYNNIVCVLWESTHVQVLSKERVCPPVSVLQVRALECVRVWAVLKHMASLQIQTYLNLIVTNMSTLDCYKYYAQNYAQEIQNIL